MRKTIIKCLKADYAFVRDVKTDRGGKIAYILVRQTYLTLTQCSSVRPHRHVFRATSYHSEVGSDRRVH